MTWQDFALETCLPDTDSARKLAAYSNGGQHQKKLSRFLLKILFSQRNPTPEYCSRLGCVPLGWSGSGSVIQDHSDHGVHQRNRWIHSGHGFIGSFDAPWSEWSWVTDPDPDHPKGTRPFKWPISSATSCIDKLLQTPHRKSLIHVRSESTNSKQILLCTVPLGRSISFDLINLQWKAAVTNDTQHFQLALQCMSVFKFRTVIFCVANRFELKVYTAQFRLKNAEFCGQNSG